MANLLKNKGSFFCTVERSLTNLIENRIKERDKAHFYSYRYQYFTNLFLEEIFFFKKK
jgi:hypothetical protein